jgi:hypothetical protein
MSWKSTVKIERDKAIQLIIKAVMEASNRELEDALEGLGFGENINLPYFGNNFMVLDRIEEGEDSDY